MDGRHLAGDYFGRRPCGCNGDAWAAREVTSLRGVRARRLINSAAREISNMPQRTQKHFKKAVPVAGAVGLSMAMTGGASATGAVGPTPDVQLRDTPPQVTLHEEEIFDVSLGTFFVFDKEVDMSGQQFAQRAGRGCRGCGAAGRGCRAVGRGCGAVGRGCGAVGRGCGGCRGCRGCSVGGCRACIACAGCGGCSCGCCVSWGACRFVC